MIVLQVMPEMPVDDTTLLQEAISVANVFQKQGSVQRAFSTLYPSCKAVGVVKLQFGSENDTSNMYVSVLHSRGIHSSCVTASTIFLNSIFAQRFLKRIDVFEKNRIVFFLGICILHALGHILHKLAGGGKAQWEILQGGKLMPMEAGEYVEKMLFAGTCRLCLRKGKGNQHKMWNPSMKMAKILVHDQEGEKKEISQKDIDFIVKSQEEGTERMVTLLEGAMKYTKTKGEFCHKPTPDEKPRK